MFLFRKPVSTSLVRFLSPVPILPRPDSPKLEILTTDFYFFKSVSIFHGVNGCFGEFYALLCGFYGSLIHDGQIQSETWRVLRLSPTHGRSPNVREAAD